MKIKMDKKKIIISLAAIFIILFLLLPVFKGGHKKTAKEKAAAQIASSNPLAKAVQILASVFGLNKPAARDGVAGGQYSNAAPQQHTGVTENGGGAPRAVTGGGNYNDDNVRLPEDLTDNYGAAEVRDNEGNWVLIRQSRPPVSTRGMYEADMKEDPASVIEGRRISEVIALGSAPSSSAGINIFTPLMPLVPAASGAAQRGAEFAANSFRAPGGFYSGSGGGYYARGGSGGSISGFGGYDKFNGLGPSGINDLDRIFAAAQAQAAQAARDRNEMRGPDGKPLSAKEREEVRREQEKERAQEAFDNAWERASDSALAKLKAAAAEELAENNGQMTTFDKVKEYDNAGVKYYVNPVPEQEIRQREVAAAGEILGKMIPGFNDGARFPPALREKYIRSYLYGTREDGVPPFPPDIKPKYVYMLRDAGAPPDAGGNNENGKPANKPCPSQNGCYWFVMPNSMSPYQARSWMAGADLDQRVAGIPGSTDPDSDWSRSTKEDADRFINSVKNDPSVYIITTAANGERIVGDTGARAFNILYQTKDGIITQNTSAGGASLPGTDKNTVQQSAENSKNLFLEYAAARNELVRENMEKTSPLAALQGKPPAAAKPAAKPPAGKNTAAVKSASAKTAPAKQRPAAKK
ncbi:MAG: hypothetical protein LBI01_04060 [Elusimicrobium sp.]|jgi:hypothetical protein|nr:hypothetical protein [Elusimicrobium sp.]